MPWRSALPRMSPRSSLSWRGRYHPRPSGRGLADELAALLASLGESGREVGEVVEATPALHAAAAGAAEGDARRAFANALDELESELRAARVRRAPSQTAIKALDAIADFR